MSLDLREAVARIGPSPVAMCCRGCPAFRTNKWDEPSGDGETYDSGQYAWCAAAGQRSMGAYHYDHSPTPDWCPAPDPQLSDLTVRIGELEGALEPFAAFFDRTTDMGGNFPKAGPFYTLMSMNGPVELSIEDFQRARQALAAKAGGEGSSQEPSTMTNAAPSASGLADPTSSGAE